MYRQMDRQTDRQTDRWKDTDNQQTDRKNVKCNLLIISGIYGEQDQATNEINKLFWEVWNSVLNFHGNIITSFHFQWSLPTYIKVHYHLFKINIVLEN